MTESVAALLRRVAAQVWFDRFRWLGTATAVALCVATTSTVLGLAVTLTQAGERDVRAAARGIEAVVRGPVITQDDGAPGESSALRAPVAPRLLDQVAASSGVSAASGDVERYAQLVVDGRLVAPENVSAFVGGVWVADPELAEFRLDAGRAPAAAGEVVVDRVTADRAGVALGDAVKVLYDFGTIDARVVGVARYGPATHAPSRSTVLFEQSVIAESVGRFDRIVARSDSLTEAELAASLVATLGPGVEVVTGSAATEERVRAVNAAQTLVRGILVGAAVLAVLIGALVSASSIAIALVQRRRDMAMTRLIGAERRQVVSAVVLEVALVAIAGAVAGAVLAVVVDGPVAAILRWIGVDVAAGESGQSPAVLLLSAVVGVGAAVAAGLRPAWRASSTPPLQGLRDADLPSSRLGGTRAAVAAAGLVGGLGLVVTGTGPVAVGGVALTVVATAVLAPVVVRAVGAAAERLGRALSASGLLGARQVRRDPGRVATAAVGLWLSAAVLIATAVLSSSLTAAVVGTARSAMKAELVASSVDDDAPTITAEAVDRVAQDDRVVVASALRAVEAALLRPGAPAASVDLAGVDPATISQVYDLRISGGRLDTLAAGSLAVHTSTGMAVGDTATIKFASGATRRFTVGALFAQRFAGFAAQDYLIGDETLRRLAGPGLYSEVFVDLDGSLGTDAGRTLVTDLLGAGGGIVRDATEYGDPTSTIGPARTLIDALAWIAVLIAIVGLTSGTVLSVAARRRTIATLRAVGGTRTQVWWMITVETVVTGVVAALLAGVAGLALSTVLVELLAADEPVPWTVPGPQVGAVLAALVVLSALVAVAPALSASRRSPVEGLSRP